MDLREITQGYNLEHKITRNTVTFTHHLILINEIKTKMEHVRSIYTDFGVKIEKMATFDISGAETSGSTTNILININSLYFLHIFTNRVSI